MKLKKSMVVLFLQTTVDFSLEIIHLLKITNLPNGTGLIIICQNPCNEISLTDSCSVYKSVFCLTNNNKYQLNITEQKLVNTQLYFVGWILLLRF